MKSWTKALGDGAISGSLASIVTTAVLAGCGKQENGTPFAPVNAISHWIQGDHAKSRNDPSLRYTLQGYMIHHASATFWAVLYEKWFGERADRKKIPPAIGGGAVVAALACFADFNMTPRRLRPGYENRLSRRSLFFVYGAFGVALALRGLMSGSHWSPAVMTPCAAKPDECECVPLHCRGTHSCAESTGDHQLASRSGVAVIL